MSNIESKIEMQNLPKIKDLEGYASFNEVIKYCKEIMVGDDEERKKELQRKLSSPLVGATGILYHHYPDVRLYDRGGGIENSVSTSSDAYVMDSEALPYILEKMKDCNTKRDFSSLEFLAKRLSVKRAEVRHWGPGHYTSEYRFEYQSGDAEHPSVYSPEQVEEIYSLMGLFKAKKREAPLTGKYPGVNDRSEFGISNQIRMSPDEFVESRYVLANERTNWAASKEYLRYKLFDGYGEREMKSNERWVLALPYIQLEHPIEIDEGLPRNYCDDWGRDKVDHPDRNVTYLEPRIRIGHILMNHRGHYAARTSERQDIYDSLRQDVGDVNFLKMEGGRKNEPAK
ncbi:MAG: hypothetical protein WCK90_03675 [archaeon]